MEANEVEVLEWPAKSPDLSITENALRQLVSYVYENGRQYKH